MIRVVVTVLLAVAIVAAAMPAVEHAGEDRSDAAVRVAIDDIDDAATDLARSEEAVPGTAGARRSVTVRLPAAAVGSAPVDRLELSGTDRRYTYQVAGRDARTVRGTVPVYTLDGEPLVLREPGRHDLVLALVSLEGQRRVVVAREFAVRDGQLD